MATKRSLQLAAQAWCDPSCGDKVMDSVLAEAFADILDTQVALALDAMNEACDTLIWASGAFGTDELSAAWIKSGRPTIDKVKHTINRLETAPEDEVRPDAH